MMAKLINCILVFLCLFQMGISQSEEVDFDKYFHTSLGGGYGFMAGEIGEHLNSTLGFGTGFGAGISKNGSVLLEAYYHLADSNESFSLEQGATHKSRPDILNVSLGYDRVFGNASNSHFHALAGLGYSWFNYQDSGSGMKGLIPKLEIAWALRFRSKVGSITDNTVRYGRRNVRVFDVKTQSGLSHYRPVMSANFVDFFLRYSYMNLNNPQGKGHLILVGARYKKMVYSEAYVPGENDL